MSYISQAQAVNAVQNPAQIYNTAQGTAPASGNDFATLLAAQIGASMIKSASAAFDGTSTSSPVFSLNELLSAAAFLRAANTLNTQELTEQISDTQLAAAPAMQVVDEQTTSSASGDTVPAAYQQVTPQSIAEATPGAFGLTVTNATSAGSIRVTAAGSAAAPVYNSNLGEQVVQRALSRLGDPYSQSMRGSGNYVDCSYLTQWAYSGAGIEIPGTAAEQARYCVDNGYTISYEQLQPGDLVFWKRNNCDCGRYGEIHHVAVYLGNDRIVEASSSSGKVIENDLWNASGPWELALFARPS